MITILSLFLGAFLAATILPFSSEVMLVTVLKAGQVPVMWLLTAASLGNILGAALNWWLGRYMLHWTGRRWFPFSQKQVDNASVCFNKYGTWSLLFAFVPIIGDPLTFVAGMLRVKFPLFLLLVSIGKIGRYLFLVWVV